jgi:hypothetical protein
MRQHQPVTGAVFRNMFREMNKSANRRIEISIAEGLDVRATIGHD